MSYWYVLVLPLFLGFGLLTVTLAGMAKASLPKWPRLAEAISTVLFLITAAAGVGAGMWVGGKYTASHPSTSDRGEADGSSARKTGHSK